MPEYENPTAQRVGQLKDELIWFAENYGYLRDSDKDTMLPEYKMTQLESELVHVVLHIIWNAAIVFEFPKHHRPTPIDRKIEDNESV